MEREQLEKVAQSGRAVSRSGMEGVWTGCGDCILEGAWSRKEARAVKSEKKTFILKNNFL